MATRDFDSSRGSSFSELEEYEPPRPARTPGKMPATARLSRGGPVLRLSDPATAAAFARALQGGAGGGTQEASAKLDRAADEAGQALPRDLRERFEGSLGADLGDVRLHSGAASAAAARAVGAQAYTVGQDVHFAAGRYDPGSSDGQRLLAHEVAHTVQQQSGSASVRHKLEVSSPGDAIELEADRAADAMVAGESFSVAPAAGASGAIARSKEKGAKSGGTDKDEDKPVYPKWENESVSVDVLPKLGGNLKFNWGENPGADFGIKGAAEHEFFKIKKSAFVPIYGPLGMDIAAEASAALTAEASANMTATWSDAPGPRIERELQMTLGATGGGKVAATMSGSLKVGAGVGTQAVRIAGGGQATLSGEGSMAAALGGALTRGPDGDTTGLITFTVTGKVEVKAEGALYFDVVLPHDRYNMYKYKLGEKKLAELSIACVSMYDGSKTTALPPVMVKSFYWPKAMTKVGMRPLTDAEKRDRLPVNNGASGAPGAMDKETPIECPDEPGGGGAGGYQGECPVPATPEPPSSTSDGSGGAPPSTQDRDSTGGGGGPAGGSGGAGGAGNY